MSLKDNKIDIMCNKIGDMITLINGATTREYIVDNIIKGLRQLQYDLELLRKCSIDNPDFKWSEAKHAVFSGNE